MAAEFTPDPGEGTGLDEAIAAYLTGLRGGGQDPAHRPGLRRDPAPLPDGLRRGGVARSGRGLPPGPRLRASSRSSQTAASPSGPGTGASARPGPSSPGALAWATASAEPVRGDPQRQGGAEGDPAAHGGGDPGAAGRLRPRRRSSAAATGRSSCSSSTPACATAELHRLTLADVSWEDRPHPYPPRQGGANSAWCPSATGPTMRLRDYVEALPRGGAGGRCSSPSRAGGSPAAPDEPVPLGHPLRSGWARVPASTPIPTASVTPSRPGRSRTTPGSWTCNTCWATRPRRWCAATRRPTTRPRRPAAHAAFSPAARLLATEASAAG